MLLSRGSAPDGESTTPRERLLRGLREQAGFSLVEAVVASLVLIIGIGAAITVFVSSGHAGATAERHQAAVALAQEELERIRSLPYEEIGLASTAYPGELDGELPDPASRVQANNYLPLNADEERLPVERLVVSEPGRSYTLAPYETREMESRSGTETAHIYRFVTWRDEECPLLTLGDLDLASVGDTVTQLVNGLNVEVAGAGLVGTAESSRNTLINLGGITNPVLGQVNELLALLNELLEPATRLINEVVAPAQERLIASLSRLTGLDLTLDLCDLDLSTLQRLRTVRGALEGIQEPLQLLSAGETNQARGEIIEATDAAVAAAERQVYCHQRPWNLGCLVSALFRGLIDRLVGVVDRVAGLLIGTGAAGDGLIEKVEQVPPDIGAALTEASGGAISDLTQLSQFIDETLTGLDVAGTDENTKRVVIAVVLEHGGPAGPRQPIWISTVVTDPYAGLLQG